MEWFLHDLISFVLILWLIFCHIYVVFNLIYHYFLNHKLTLSQYWLKIFFSIFIKKNFCTINLIINHLIRLKVSQGCLNDFYCWDAEEIFKYFSGKLNLLIWAIKYSCLLIYGCENWKWLTFSRFKLILTEIFNLNLSKFIGFYKRICKVFKNFKSFMTVKNSNFPNNFKN